MPWTTGNICTLTVVLVTDAAEADDAFPALDVGAVEWNLMNDNPY